MQFAYFSGCTGEYVLRTMARDSPPQFLKKWQKLRETVFQALLFPMGLVNDKMFSCVFITQFLENILSVQDTRLPFGGSPVRFPARSGSGTFYGCISVSVFVTLFGAIRNSLRLETAQSVIGNSSVLLPHLMGQATKVIEIIFFYFPLGLFFFYFILFPL
jgi:hypothetical protein